MSRRRIDEVERERLAGPANHCPAVRTGARLEKALPVQAALMLSLQRSLGNRALTGLLQRGQERLPLTSSHPPAPVVQRNFDDADERIGYEATVPPDAADRTETVSALGGRTVDQRPARRSTVLGLRTTGANVAVAPLLTRAALAERSPGPGVPAEPRVAYDRSTPAKGIERSGLRAGAPTPSTELRLQRSLGDAAVARVSAQPARDANVPACPPQPRLQAPVVQRRLTIAGEDIPAERITRESRHVNPLDVLIDLFARRAGLDPGEVRQELVAMATDGDYAFPYRTAAVREAIRRRLTRLVERALAGLSGADLSKEVILQRLEKVFGGGLLEASRRPEFAEALLEAIRHRQSRNWREATQIHHVKPATWMNKELQHWNLRHYTNKFMVVLGQPVPGEDRVFAVQEVQPPPFSELLSLVTLETMKRKGGTTEAVPAKSGDKKMMTYSTGATKSGHTTGVDWSNVGNVGDTFYALFYKDVLASSAKPPAFIDDAVYYARWPASEFGLGWASSDWLGDAKFSQKIKGPTPGGKARQGALSDIIADVFPEAATADFDFDTLRQRPNEGTDEERLSTWEWRFDLFTNFEVKKHGPMPVRAWEPVQKSVEAIKRRKFDAKTGEFVN